MKHAQMNQDHGIEVQATAGYVMHLAPTADLDRVPEYFPEGWSIAEGTSLVAGESYRLVSVTSAAFLAPLLAQGGEIAEEWRAAPPATRNAVLRSLKARGIRVVARTAAGGQKYVCALPVRRGAS